MILLGPKGSFSHSAGVFFTKKTKQRRSFVFVKSFDVLFKKVSEGQQALIPIKNKIIGEITPVKKHLKKVKIELSFKMPISFVLAAKKKMPLSEVKKLFVPKVAYAQCKKFVKKFLPKAKVVFSSDSTSAALQKIVKIKNAAALGSASAAKFYKLAILARNVQDDPRDWTEFALIKGL